MGISNQKYSVIEHYLFKRNGNYICLNVKTLDVYILNKAERDIVKAFSKKNDNKMLSMANIEHGETIVNESIKVLLDNDILKEKSERTKHISEYLSHSENTTSPINAIDLLISEDCNLACKYCFVKNGKYQDRSKLMSIDIGKKSVDFLIQESASLQDLFICFFGGEPLINFKTLKKIIAYATEQGKKNDKHFYFSLTTNGTLLNNEMLDFIETHQIYVIISIDGNMESHNLNRPYSGEKESYQQLSINLEKLNKRNIHYSARATVSSLTKNMIVQNFDHLVALGFRKIHFENALAPTGKIFISTDEDVKDIQKQYFLLSKKANKTINSDHSYNLDTSPLPLKAISEKTTKTFPCSAGRGSVAVDSKGDIYLCHRLVGEKNFLSGSVTKSTYNSKWTEIIEKEISVDNKKICKKCWARYLCGGGCYGINYEFHEDISVTPKIYCKLKKHTLKLALCVYADALHTMPN